MIFKTITDETTLSGQRIVGALQARKIAQQQATAQLEIDIACLKEYQVACQNGTVTTEQFDVIMHKASASAVEYSAKVKAGTGTAQSYANAQRATNSALQEVSIGAGIASKAVKLFSTALNMIAFTAIIQGISWLIGKVDEWIVTAKEAKESANAFKESLSTFFNETQTNLKTISSLSDRFDELSKNVDDNGKKVGGTEEEYAEFLDICQQVGQIMPELITGYTAEGEAIIMLQGKVDSLTDSYKEAIRTKAALFLSNGDEEGNSIKSFFEDYNDFVNGYQGVLGLKTSPSGQNTAEEFEEYYGYDKIHGWLSDVTDATLEDLEKLRAGTTEYVYLGRVLKEAGYEISEISADNYNAVHDIFNSRMSAMEKGITDRVTNIRTAFQNMLYADSDYWKINDENVISAINSIYASIDDEFIKKNELFTQTALQTFESDFVSLFNNDATKQAMVDFYTPVADDETVEDYADRIKSSLETVQSYCDENGITIPINFDDTEQTINDLEAQYQRAVDFAKDNFEGYDPTAFFKEHSINTQEEIDKWQEIAQGARDAAEAEKEYIQGSTLNENPISSLSITDTINQLNTQLKPAFDSLKSAYQDIFTDDGFTLENVDLSMLDSIKSKLDELNQMEGVNISIDYTSFENLARVLTDTSSTSDDVQSAFNSLATDIVSALNPAISECSGENYKLVQGLLESVGIMNSEEVMVSSLGYTYEEYIAAKGEAADAGFDLANATESEIDAFVREALESGNCGQALALLQLKKLLVNSTVINTAADVQQIMNLASAAGMGAEVLTQLANAKGILGTVEAGGTVSLNSYQKALDDVQSAKQTMLDWKPVEVDFGNVGGGKKAAGGAGKESADAYLEAFEKELSGLDDLKSRGKITEKQYLDALRRLYVKYFNQKKKYLKEFEKYENQYLDGMKSLYESAFNYITKQIDRRIDAINAEKNAAISALEAERDARLEAIEAQKEQLENEIEGIEKEIKAKEKEIKAMQDANGERKRAIDLQKAEYDLQRMQNQRASLVYKDGQMSYEADTSGIRDAKQEVEDKKLEIDISNIEKEIDLLEEQKDLLQEQIDLLDKEADRINDYYDKLIAGTEKQYDAMVKGMEEYKSQFDELLELFENARLEAALSELGVNMDALLNGSQEEFEKLKTAYIGILADMGRGNDEVIGQLSRLAGVNAESVSYLESTKGAFENLGEVTLEGLGNSVDGVADSVSGLAASAAEASDSVGGIQESVDGTSQSIAPLNGELERLNGLIAELAALLNDIEFPEIGDDGYAQKLRDIASAFSEIAVKCAEFQQIDFDSIIGSGAPIASGNGGPLSGGGATDTQGQAGTGFMGLASAMLAAVSSINEQMDILKDALQGGNDAFAEQIRVITEEYIPAWEELQKRLSEIIGVGGGDGGGNKKSGDGNKSVDGNGGSGSGGGNGSIIDTIESGGIEVGERLQDPWLKSFNDFATDGDNSIRTICEEIIRMVSEMADIIQEKCAAAAAALDALANKAASALSSVGGHAEGTVGNAYANGTGGYKGLPHDEKNALRSEYGQPELTVYPNGRAELTTEPVMGDLPKGTVIFNEEQTKRIMKNKGKELGGVHAEGTVITPDGRVLTPVTPDDRIYWMQKKFEEYFRENKDAFIKPTNAMFEAAESMNRVADIINNSNTMNRTEITIGDIHLHEVQDADRLSDELILRLPNKILQKMHKV